MALRYDTECYVESEAICQRLDSSIVPEPSLSSYPIGLIDRAVLCTNGFFPAVARYLKHAEDGDGKDLRLRNDLELVLSKLNSHLDREERTGPYLVGDGERITLVDCALAPKLYHLSVGLIAFKILWIWKVCFQPSCSMQTLFSEARAFRHQVILKILLFGVGQMPGINRKRKFWLNFNIF